MSDHCPLVSVAIVTYNQKEFLIPCINSVLDQDYTNLEIVVADDGSPDGTREILEDYRSRYPNLFVLVLADQNQGITTNHNNAYMACKGKYIAWMGGDDLMLPGKISKQVEFMENNSKCVISYHQLNIFDSTANKMIGLFNSKSNTHEGTVEKLIKYGSFNGGCSCMVRSSHAPTEGFNKTIPIASDWLYYIECLIKGGEIRYIDQTLGTYRRHQKNVTDENNPRFIQNILDHLGTCSIIIAKYPEYGAIAFKRYCRILRDYRKLLKLDYDLLIQFGDSKSFVAYLIYKLSFKKIKL